MHGYPHFSFWIPITLANIYFFPIVITFANIHLCQEAPSLIITFPVQEPVTVNGMYLYGGLGRGILFTLVPDFSRPLLHFRATFNFGSAIFVVVVPVWTEKVSLTLLFCSCLNTCLR